MPGSTVLQIFQDSLTEIGAYSIGNAISAEDAQFCLRTINRMLDQWNAEQLKIYAITYIQFMMITGEAAQPFTIGPTGNITQNPRPEKIMAANIILNQAGPQNIVRNPVNIRDKDWWINQRTPQIQTSLPTDLYYNPTFPNGSIYMWPVPTVAYPLELQIWQVLTQIPNLTFQFSMPPAYENAVMYELAVRLAGPFRSNISPTTLKAWEKAISALENMNSQPPTMSTTDSGIPKAERNRPTFNYHTGSSTTSNGSR